MTDTQRLELFLFFVSAIDFVLLIWMLKALRDQNLMIHSLSRRVRDMQREISLWTPVHETLSGHRIGEV
jgi:hypothetical protein